MNECLTTPQHEKQIGYWVSEKGINLSKSQTKHKYVVVKEVFAVCKCPVTLFLRKKQK